MSARLLRVSMAAVLLSLLSMVPDARAALFCVDTENELTGALAVSLINNQQNEIRLVSGSYSMPDGWSNPSASPFPQALKLSGGWNNDCSTRTTINPSSTTIQGQSSSNSRWLFSAYASLIIDGLSFVQAAGLVLFSPNDCTPFGQEFLVRRVRVSNSVSGIGNWASMTAFTLCHDVRIENSLIVGGALDGLEIQCFSDAVGSYRLINNTVRDHGGFDFVATYDSQSCAGNLFGADSLYNNVFGSMQLDANTPRAYNNIHSSLSSTNGGGFFPGSSNNLAVDPQLDPITYRPVEPGSSAINSGTSDVPDGLPSTDIAGDPREVGGIPDRGAFESSVIPPGPFILTVTSGTDSGPGSLREVINQANAGPGLNLVRFQLSGCSFQIQLTSPLPDITDDVIIDGYSQSGASFNTLDNGNDSVLCISVVPQPSASEDVPWAFRVPPGSNARLTVRGLRLGGFDAGGGLFGEAPIVLQGGDGHRIQGNHFGSPSANTEGVRLMNDATGALIGGSSPASRNTFGKSTLAAIHIIGTASHGHSVVNNYIGTTPSGLGADGNHDGIRIIQSADNEVLDNLISGNGRDGIYISGEQATGNVIGNNRIGGIRGGFFQICGPSPLPPCPAPLSNRKGIFIDNEAGQNTIGQATLAGGPNRIRFSTQHGIRVLSGQQNRILTNTLFDNGTGANELDIDIDAFGLGGIDSDCGTLADGKGNRGQNRPVIDAAGGNGTTLSVTGSLSSCTNSASFDAIYRLQFYASNNCAANGHGPGQYFLGDHNVFLPGPAQSDVTEPFTAELEHPWLSLGGKYITATATDLFGNTSEFSQCLQAEVSDVLFSDRFED